MGVAVYASQPHLEHAGGQLFEGGALAPESSPANVAIIWMCVVHAFLAIFVDKAVADLKASSRRQASRGRRGEVAEFAH